MKSFLLLSNPRRDEPNPSILKIVFTKIHDSQCMVGPKNASKMLAIFGSKMVAAKMELFKILIELHSSHCRQRYCVPDEGLFTYTGNAY